MSAPGRIAALSERLRSVHPAVGAMMDRLAPHWGEIRTFFGVFVVCLLCLHVFAASGLVWHVLDARYRNAPDHQIHAALLPVPDRDVRLAIVGDSLFHASIPAKIADQPGTRRIVINAYDADDLRDVFTAAVLAERRLGTRICHVIAQVMPVFAVRAKAWGKRQNLRLLQQAARLDAIAVDRSAKVTFGALDAWAGLAPVDDPLAEPHGRLTALRGQGRDADPTRENWGTVMRQAERYSGAITFVDDQRITDLGPDSGLPAAMQAMIADSADPDGPRMNLIGLDEVGAFELSQCPKGPDT